ncbi:MAG: hypothetical protein ACI4KF_10140 [Huintestinicola sp.]
MNYNFDDLINSSKSVFDMVASSASNAMNVSKAYVEKAQLRVKLRDKYNELGKLCYDMHEKGTDETGSIKIKIKEIKVLKAQLEYAEEAAGKPKICPICGRKNLSDDLFCSQCGEKL